MLSGGDLPVTGICRSLDPDRCGPWSAVRDMPFVAIGWSLPEGDPVDDVLCTLPKLAPGHSTLGPPLLVHSAYLPWSLCKVMLAPRPFGFLRCFGC